MRVLVTDGHDRKSLAALRSLASRGAEVWAAGTSHLDQALHSRRCAGRVLLPNPAQNMQGFGEGLLDLMRRKRFDVLLPMGDHSTACAASLGESLARHVHLVVPPPALLELARDKASLLEAGRRFGLATPQTWVPADLEEVRAFAPGLHYPCVLKPRAGAGAIGVEYPRSPQHLLDLWARPPRASDSVYRHDELVVQEYVDGEMHSVNVLFVRGRCLAAATHVRLAAHPASGGRSALVETTWKPELRETAIAFMESLAWHGPAQVQFIVPGGGGRPVLMEVNARFWGSIGLHIAAGIDFAWLTCLAALDRRFTPVSEYTVGQRYAWPLPSCLGYVATADQPVQAIKHLLTAARGATTDLDPCDPAPAVANILGVARAWLARRWIRM
jgi:predicted ATP-grasp superfamily ATP-dependent carboligase